MAYEIQVSKQAAKYISKLDATERKRFKQQIDTLASDPYANSKQLVNADPPTRSMRIGGVRLILRIIEAKKVVIITDAGPRGQIYRNV